MAVLAGLAYVLFSFGPAIVFILGVTARSASFTIAAVTSSFFWLVSIMLPSIIHVAVPGAKDHAVTTLLISVICQEIGRFLFVKLYYYSEDALVKKTATLQSPFNEWSMAISSGVGFGLMSSLVMYGGALSGAFEEEVYSDFYLDQCPDISVYVYSASTSLIFQVLNVALMVLMFFALKASNAAKRYSEIALVVLLHLAASLMSLGSQVQGGCAAVLAGQSVLVVLTLIMVGYKNKSYHYYLQ